MYHLTRRRSLLAILHEGLVGGRPVLFADQTTPAELRRIYGVIPIFLSRTPWMEPDYYDLLAAYGPAADFVLLEVDVAGLTLVADVMSLVDFGAQLGEDHLWFEQRDTPLAAFEANEVIPFTALTQPGPACSAAIAWSGAVACLTPIAPSRLRVAD